MTCYLTGRCSFMHLPPADAVSCFCAARTPATLPDHPRLLLNADGVAQPRSASRGSVAKLLEKLKTEIDRELPNPLSCRPGRQLEPQTMSARTPGRLEQGRKVGTWQWEHNLSVRPPRLARDSSKASLTSTATRSAVSTTLAHWWWIMVSCAGHRKSHLCQ